jgi:hypothetical protein
MQLFLENWEHYLFATIDLHAPSLGAERVFLSDPHSQVNSLLAPKLTDYAK